MIKVGPPTDETGKKLWPVYDDAEPEYWFCACAKEEDAQRIEEALAPLRATEDRLRNYASPDLLNSGVPHVHIIQVIALAALHLGAKLSAPSEPTPDFLDRVRTVEKLLRGEVRR